MGRTFGPTAARRVRGGRAAGGRRYLASVSIVPGALAGRDRELDFLQEFFRQAAVSGGALFLSGDPGVGKTALVNALAEPASACGTTVLLMAG